MQASNTTALEGKFSQFRAHGIVTAEMLESLITNSSNRGSISALANKQSNYRSEDDVGVGGSDENYGITFSGAALFKKHGKQLDERVKKLLSIAGENNEAAPAQVSRFGSNSDDLHKTEIMKILADDMTSQDLAHSSFRMALMKDEGFQYWYRLSSYSSREEKWFREFATSDDFVMNEICQGVLRTLFSKFEDSVHGTILSFERGYLDYIMSREFEEMYQQKLPVSLQGNRKAALYLVDTLKSLFESWWYESVAKLTKPESENNSKNAGGINEEAVVIQTHNMVGGAMPKLKEMFRTNAEVLKVVETMYFQSSKDASASGDKEYVDKYLPQYIQHRDRGGYHLLRKEYITWAIDLMKSCLDLGSDVSMNRKRRTWVKAALETLRDEDHGLHSSFHQIVTSTNSSLDNHTVYTMYRRIVDYTMRAYAGFRNDMRNNPEKRLSTSLNNVKFRTLVQTGSKVSKVDKPKEKKKTECEMMTEVNRRNNVQVGDPPSSAKSPKSTSGRSKDDLLNEVLHLDGLIAEGEVGRPKLPLNTKHLQPQDVQQWLLYKKSQWGRKVENNVQVGDPAASENLEQGSTWRPHSAAAEKRSRSPPGREISDAVEKRSRPSEERLAYLREAIVPLQLDECDRKFAKLSKDQCISILTTGFEVLRVAKTTRHGTLMGLVHGKLMEDGRSKPFWRFITNEELLKRAAIMLKQKADEALSKSQKLSKKKNQSSDGDVAKSKSSATVEDPTPARNQT